jgi:hypothetical protein
MYSDLDEDSSAITPASIPDSLVARVDSILLSTGYDADSTLFDFARYVRNNQDDYKAATAGTGAYPCSLYVFDDEDSSTAVQGVYVRVKNSDGSATSATDLTDDNGLSVTSLDANDYQVWMYKAGVTATNPDTITVTSPSLTDTLYVDVFSPSAPADPDLVTIYGYVYDIQNNAVENAIVTVRPSSYNLVRLSDTLLIANTAKIDTTDSDGYWSMAVYPTSDLGVAIGSSVTTDSTRVFYKIEARYGDDLIGSQTIRVPDQATWQVQLRRNF